MDYLYVLQTLRESAPDFVNYIFVFVSEYLIKFTIFLCAIIYWAFNKKVGVSVVLGYSGTFTLNQTIKNTVCVYRPWIRDTRLYVYPKAQAGATGYSFPSGHTVSSAYFLGSFSVWQKKRKWLCCLMTLVILMIAFARNWLGAHTLSDVMIALLNACLGICITNCLVYLFSKHEDKDYLVMIAAVFVSVVILIIMEFKSYPMDYSLEGKILVDPYLMKTDCYSACGVTCGSFIGWFLERRFVKFEDTDSRKSKILRLISGTIGFAFFMYALTPIYNLMGRNIGHLVKYFLTIFYSVFGAPLLFKKLKLY